MGESEIESNKTKESTVKNFFSKLMNGEFSDEDRKDIPFLMSFPLSRGKNNSTNLDSSTFLSKFRNIIRIDDYQKLKNSVERDQDAQKLLPFNFYFIKKINQYTKNVTAISDSTVSISNMEFDEKDTKEFNNLLSVIDSTELPRYLELEDQEFMTIDDLYQISDESKLSEHCIYNYLKGRINDNPDDIIIPEEYGSNDQEEVNEEDKKEGENPKGIFNFAKKIKEELENNSADFYQYDNFNNFMINKSKEFYDDVKDVFPAIQKDQTEEEEETKIKELTAESIKSQDKYFQLFLSLTHLYLPTGSLIEKIRQKFTDPKLGDVFGAIYDALQVLTIRGLFFIDANTFNESTYTFEGKDVPFCGSGYNFNPYINYFAPNFPQVSTQIESHRKSAVAPAPVAPAPVAPAPVAPAPVAPAPVAPALSEVYIQTTKYVNLYINYLMDLMDSMVKNDVTLLELLKNLQQFLEDQKIIINDLEIQSEDRKKNLIKKNLTEKQKEQIEKRIKNKIIKIFANEYETKCAKINFENDKLVEILFKRITTLLEKLKDFIGEKIRSGEKVESSEIIKLFNQESWYSSRFEKTGEKNKAGRCMRYCVNFIGGRLDFLQETLKGKIMSEDDPVLILQQFLEIQYLLSLYSGGSGGIENVSLDKPIKIILYILYLNNKNSKGDTLGKNINSIVMPEDKSSKTSNYFQYVLDNHKELNNLTKSDKLNINGEELFEILLNSIEKTYPILVSPEDSEENKEKIKNFNQIAEEFLTLKSKIYYFYTTNYVFSKQNYFFKPMPSFTTDANINEIFTTGWNNINKTVSIAKKYTSGSKARVKLLLPDFVIEELNDNRDLLLKEVKSSAKISSELNKEDFNRLYRYAVSRITNRVLYNYVVNSQLTANKYYINKRKDLLAETSTGTSAETLVYENLNSLKKIKDAAEKIAETNMKRIEDIKKEREIITKILSNNDIEFCEFLIKETLYGYKLYKNSDGTLKSSEFKRNLKSMRNNCDIPLYSERPGSKTVVTEFVTAIGNKFNMNRFRKRYSKFSKFLLKKLDLGDSAEDKELKDLLNYFNSKCLCPIFLDINYTNKLISYNIFSDYEYSNEFFSKFGETPTEESTTEKPSSEEPSSEEPSSEEPSSEEPSSEEPSSEEPSSEEPSSEEPSSEELDLINDIIFTQYPKLDVTNKKIMDANFIPFLQMIIIQLLNSLELKEGKGEPSKNPEKEKKDTPIILLDSNEAKGSQKSSKVVTLLKKLVIFYCALMPLISESKESTDEEPIDSETDDTDEELTESENLANKQKQIISIFTDIPVIFPQPKFLQYFGKAISAFLEDDQILEYLEAQDLKFRFTSFKEISELILLYIALFRLLPKEKNLPEEKIKQNKEAFNTFISKFIELELNVNKLTTEDTSSFEDLISIIGPFNISITDDDISTISNDFTEIEIPGQQLKQRRSYEVFPLPMSSRNQTIGKLDQKFVEFCSSLRSELSAAKSKESKESKESEIEPETKEDNVFKSEQGYFVKYVIPRDRYIKNLDSKDLSNFFENKSPLIDEFNPKENNETSGSADDGSSSSPAENTPSNNPVDSVIVNLIKLFDCEEDDLESKNQYLYNLNDPESESSNLEEEIKNKKTKIEDQINFKTNNLAKIRRLELASWTLSYALKYQKEEKNLLNLDNLISNPPSEKEQRIFSTILQEIYANLNLMDIENKNAKIIEFKRKISAFNELYNLELTIAPVESIKVLPKITIALAKKKELSPKELEEIKRKIQAKNDIHKFADNLAKYVKNIKKKGQNKLSFDYYRKETFERQLKAIEAIGKKIKNPNSKKSNLLDITLEKDPNNVEEPSIKLDRKSRRTVSQQIIECLLEKMAKIFVKFNKYIRPETATIKFDSSSTGEVSKTDNYELTCGVKLHKSLLKKIENGANIGSIFFLKGKYPSRHVISNVQLIGSIEAVHPVPRFLEKDNLNNLIKDLQDKQNVVLGMDDNRLNCLFTFCFEAGKLNKLEELSKLGKNEFPSDIDESNYFLNVLKKLSTKQTKEFVLLLLGQFKIEDNEIEFTPAGKNFFKYIMKDVFKNNNVDKEPKILVPNNLTPDKRDIERDPTPEEIIAAPIKYWAEKRNHLSMHMTSLQKLLKTKRKDPKSNKNRLLKLSNEKRLLEAKFKNLRKRIDMYLVNLTAAMVYIYFPNIFSHESLQFQKDKTGYLAVITQQMFQSMKSFVGRFMSWMKRVDSGFDVEDKGVGAAYTSKISFELNKILKVTGDFNNVDRGSNADFSYIIYPPKIDKDGEVEQAYGKIINAHKNAARNIGFRALE